MTQKKTNIVVEKIKDIGLMIFLYALIFIILFVMLLGLFCCLSEFNVLNIKIGWLIALGTSAVLSLLAFVVNAILQKKLSARYEFRLKIFFQKYGTIMIVAAAFIMFALIAFQRELVVDFEGAKSLLTIEWVIFGLSITIFLFWNVGIIKYLEKQKPKSDSNQEDIEKNIDRILEKSNFNNNVNYKFIAVVFLIVNLFVLLLSTTIVYLPPIKFDVLGQNILIFTFFVTTNTISSLLLDIVKMVWTEKKELQKSTQVSKEEISEAVDILHIIEIIKNGFDKIDKDKRLSNEQKKSQKKEIIKYVFSILPQDDNNSSDKNDDATAPITADDNTSDSNNDNE